MAVRLLRGGEDRIVVRFGQAGDVLGHGALEQFHLLGQVTHVEEAPLGGPVGDGRAVQAHHPALRDPDAHHEAGQGALAAAAGADEPGAGARFQGKTHPFQRQYRRARRRRGHALHFQQARGPGQAGRASAMGRRGAGKQVVQPEPGLARRDEAAPCRDALFDGRQRAAQDNGGGDHHARRDLLLEHQPGAQAQDAHLDDLAAGLGRCQQHAHPASPAGMERDAAVVLVAPAAAETLEHAHRLQHVRMAQAVLDEAVGFRGVLRGVAERPARGPLREQGQEQDEQRGEYRQETQPGVDQENGGNEYRRPGRVEKGQRRRAGNELAHRVQVAHGLVGALPEALQAAAEHAGQHVVQHLVIQEQGDARHQALAHPVQHAEAGQQEDRHHGQHDQGLVTGAGQYPVVHLQHIDRRHQHQYVGHGAEQSHAHETLAATA